MDVYDRAPKNRKPLFEDERTRVLHGGAPNVLSRIQGV
jgi:hypothetical protein